MATSTPVRHAWRALTGLLVITAILFGINALGVYVFRTELLDARARARPPGRHADRPRGADRGRRRPLDRADGAGGHDHPSARRRLRRRRGRGRRPRPATRSSSRSPGQADEETRNRIEASAQLQLRAVLYAGEPANTFVGEDGNETPYPRPTRRSRRRRRRRRPTAATLAWITPALQAEFLAYDCADPANDPANAPADEPLITCDADGTVKYILGPVELDGSSIDDATFGLQQTNGLWAVNLDVRRRGHEDLRRDQPAPVRRAGAAQPVRVRARRLRALGAVDERRHPRRQAEHHRQLHAGDREDARRPAQVRRAAAELHGRELELDLGDARFAAARRSASSPASSVSLLVAIYSLIVYRALGFIIIASLAVMGVLTYVTLCILAWRMGFRLSLAGVAGLIVTIGFTADSFIVYFERIRDELRDGKSITSRRRGRLGSRQAHDLHLEVDQHPRRRGAVHPGRRHGEGLRVHARPHDRDRRPHLHPVHAPGAAAAGTHEVLRVGASAVRTRPDGARRRLPRPRAVPRTVAVLATGAAGRRNVKSRGEAARRQTIAERKQAELAAATPTARNPARPPRRETTDALHEPARKRPLHRQDLLPLRRPPPPVVPHRRHPRDRLGAGAALPPDPVLDRVHRRIAVHRQRRGSTTDQSLATDAVHSVVPGRHDEGRDGRRPTRCACRPTR